MIEDTSRTPPEAIDSGSILDETLAALQTGAASRRAHGDPYMLVGCNTVETLVLTIGLLRQEVAEVEALRRFRDAIDDASTAYHSGAEWADRAVTRFDRAVRVALKQCQDELDAAHAGRGGALEEEG